MLSLIVSSQSEVQPENMLVGMLTMSESMVTVLSEVQPAKALSPKLFTFSGIYTVSRAVQFIKAYSSTVVFVFENTTSVMLSLPEKAFLSITVTG